MYLLGSIVCALFIPAVAQEGIPINKLDGRVGRLLEDGHSSLGGAGNVGQLIPLIRRAIKQKIMVHYLCLSPARSKGCIDLPYARQAAITEKKYSASFDGATKVEECQTTCIHFVQDFELRVVCASLKMLKKSFNQQTLAAFVIQELGSLNCSFNDCISVARDGAAVNGAAMTILTQIMPQAIDIRCFPHTFSLVGGKMQTLLMDKLLEGFNYLFSMVRFLQL